MKGEHISHPVHSDNCVLNGNGPGTCPEVPPAYTWRDYRYVICYSFVYFAIICKLK